MAGALEEGWAWELEVRAWQYELLLPWRRWWWRLPQALPATMVVQRISPVLVFFEKHLSLL